MSNNRAARYFIGWLIGTIGVLFANDATSQNQFRPGYVVLHSGDTVRGTLMTRKETFTGVDLLNKVRFKPVDGGRRRKYRPYEIVSYQIDGVIYESLPIRSHGISLLNAYYEINPNEGEWSFLRLISKGKLSYYQLEWTDGDNGTIDSTDLFRRENEAILVRATQGIFGLERKSLVNYFQNCPALQQKIEQKDFKYPSEVVNFYNHYCH